MESEICTVLYKSVQCYNDDAVFGWQGLAVRSSTHLMITTLLVWGLYFRICRQIKSIMTCRGVLRALWNIYKKFTHRSLTKSYPASGVVFVFLLLTLNMSLSRLVWSDLKTNTERYFLARIIWIVKVRSQTNFLKYLKTCYLSFSLNQFRIFWQDFVFNKPIRLSQ